MLVETNTDIGCHVLPYLQVRVSGDAHFEDDDGEESQETASERHE